MNTVMRFSKRAGLALALSIAAMPILVNGQPQSLSSVNQDNSSNNHVPKDGIKKLIEVLLKSGTDGDVGSNLAPVIGLPKAMPTKDQEFIITKDEKNVEMRACFVVYENTDSTESKPQEKLPVCAYVVKIKRSGLNKSTQYFRLDLSGTLEKAVLVQTKYADTGKVVKGSGVKTDLDIDSPEVRKTFEAEMKFWLKDWLKKQKKAPAKKAA